MQLGHAKSYPKNTTVNVSLNNKDLKALNKRIDDLEAILLELIQLYAKDKEQTNKNFKLLDSR